MVDLVGGAKMRDPWRLMTAVLLSFTACNLPPGTVVAATEYSGPMARP
jgi:hypothetical protein